jgi:HAD superfamily hydrolase (TIGR01490 family)
MSMEQNTGRRFAVFDLDGTLPRWQLYHATADKLAKLGYISSEGFTPIREARMAWKRREHIESFKQYELELVKLFEQILPNLTPDQLEKASRLVFEEYKDQVYTYTRGLIKDRKDEGYLLFAISGSQTEVVAPMANYHGFDDFICTDYKREDNRFTGEYTTPLGKKDEALKTLIKKYGAVLLGSVGAGDSTGDIPMLAMVEHAVAINPELKLAKHAQEQGWTTVVERKNTVYRMKNGKYELVDPEDKSAYIF